MVDSLSGFNTKKSNIAGWSKNIKGKEQDRKGGLSIENPRELAVLFALTVTETAEKSNIAKNGEMGLFTTLARILPEVF